MLFIEADAKTCYIIHFNAEPEPCTIQSNKTSHYILNCIRGIVSYNYLLTC